MPKYSISAPDGNTYSIDGPDGATRDQVIAKIKERLGGAESTTDAPAEQPSIAADIATSFGRGVVKGSAEMAGGLGDLREAAGAVSPYAKAALGSLPIVGPLSHLAPTSKQVTGAVEGVTGPLGQPQTTAGRYAESVGEFVPSAVMGPEGRVAKVTTSVLGGLGAEAGREAGGETGALIGGFAGGMAGGHATAEGIEASLRRALPGQEANKKASQAAYKMIQQAGVKIDPSVTTGFVDTLEQDLKDNFITRAGEGREIFPALDKAREGDLAELMDLHGRLGKIKPSRGELYEAAVQVRPQIRDFIENLQDHQLLAGKAGDAQYVSALWKDARDKWRIHAKLSEVEHAADAADIRRKATGRGMNWNTFRQEFKKILLNDDKTRGYSPEAVEKLEQIVKGTLVQNTARIGSAMAPQRGVLGAAPAALALAAGGVEPAGIVASIGEISHLLEGYLTKRQIRQLEDLIKRESPLAPKQQLPDRSMIAPSAAARSALAAGAGSPLAQNGQ